MVSSGIVRRSRIYRVRGDAGNEDVPCKLVKCSMVVLVKNWYRVMSVNSGVVKTKERHLSKTKNSNSTWKEKRVALAFLFVPTKVF